LRERGLSITKAALEAAQERLRPILMTALRRVLALSSWRRSRGTEPTIPGTAIFGGLLAFLSLFIVPVLYVMIGTARDRLQRLGKNDENLEPSPEEVKIPSESRVTSELSCGLIVTILNLLLVPVL